MVSLMSASWASSSPTYTRSPARWGLQAHQVRDLQGQDAGEDVGADVGADVVLGLVTSGRTTPRAGI